MRAVNSLASVKSKQLYMSSIG